MSDQWKFKPCPFCGSTDIRPKSEVVEHLMGNDCPCSAIRKIWAECEYCGARGPRRTGDVVYGNEILATALVGWNERGNEDE